MVVVVVVMSLSRYKEERHSFPTKFSLKLWSICEEVEILALCAELVAIGCGAAAAAIVVPLRKSNAFFHLRNDISIIMFMYQSTTTTATMNPNPLPGQDAKEATGGDDDKVFRPRKGRYPLAMRSQRTANEAHRADARKVLLNSESEFPTAELRPPYRNFMCSLRSSLKPTRALTRPSLATMVTIKFPRSRINLNVNTSII